MYIKTIGYILEGKPSYLLLIYKEFSSLQVISKY